MESDISKDFLEQLREDVEAGNLHGRMAEVNEMHPADIAEILQNLPLDQTRLLFAAIEEEKAADALIELDEELRGKILHEYTGREIAKNLVEHLDSDDAADLINELPVPKRREVLNNIADPEEARGLSNLLIYPDNTAGALMATELIKVNKNLKVMQCVREMRQQAEAVEQVHSIYVVDDDNQLLGTLSLKKLLTTSTQTPISQVYTDLVHSVEATEDAEDVARAMEKYDLLVMPVVDSQGQLLGRITIDDVVDLIRDEAREDYAYASGLTGDVETHDRMRTIVKARLPWLLIGLLGGIAAAWVIGRFETDLEAIPKLAFFIPLIAAMGGNVGVQSSAIIVQGLASKANMGTLSNRLMKELTVGIINGLVLGVVLIAASLFLGYGTQMAMTVSASLISVIIVAALVGTFVPLLLDRYKIDPALATGPFITTLNDILGLFIYFMIGRAILGF
jgi:magnesium transporter